MLLTSTVPLSATEIIINNHRNQSEFITQRIYKLKQQQTISATQLILNLLNSIFILFYLFSMFNLYFTNEIKKVYKEFLN